MIKVDRELLVRASALLRGVHRVYGAYYGEIADKLDALCKEERKDKILWRFHNNLDEGKDPLLHSRAAGFSIEHRAHGKSTVVELEPPIEPLPLIKDLEMSLGRPIVDCLNAIKKNTEFFLRGLKFRLEKVGESLVGESFAVICLDDFARGLWIIWTKDCQTFTQSDVDFLLRWIKYAKAKEESCTQ